MRHRPEKFCEGRDDVLQVRRTMLVIGNVNVTVPVKVDIRTEGIDIT